MSKMTIISNDLLKNEIKALYDYVNRDSCNLAIVKCMIDELHPLVMDLQPCEKVDVSSKGYESNTITGNFKDFEINSSSSKTIISCEGCSSHEDTNIYDTEETFENCTVKIWSNSDTGNVKIGWYKE